MLPYPFNFSGGEELKTKECKSLSGFISQIVQHLESPGYAVIPSFAARDLYSGAFVKRERSHFGRKEEALSLFLKEP